MDVVVYLLTNSSNREKLESVSELFQRGVYTIIAVETEATDPSPEEEYRKYMLCLSEAKRAFPQSAVLILRDDISSQVDADRMSNIIQTILRFDNWDLCYFFKYQDRCEEWKTKVNVAESDTTIVETVGAKGDLALLFSHSGRDILLGERPFVSDSDGPTGATGIGLYWNEFMQARQEKAQQDRVLDVLTFSDLLTDASALGYLRATAIVPNFFTYEETSLQRHKLSNLLLQECATSSNANRVLKTSPPVVVSTSSTPNPASFSAEPRVEPDKNPSTLSTGSTGQQPQGAVEDSIEKEEKPLLAQQSVTIAGSSETQTQIQSSTVPVVAVDTPIVHEFMRNANTNLKPRVNNAHEKAMTVEPNPDPKEKELTPYVPSSRLLLSKKTLTKIGIVFLAVLVLLTLSYVVYNKRDWIRGRVWKQQTAEKNTSEAQVAGAAVVVASEPANGASVGARKADGNRSRAAGNTSRSKHNSISVEAAGGASKRATQSPGNNSRGAPTQATQASPSSVPSGSAKRSSTSNAATASGGAHASATTAAAAYRKNESSLSEGIPPLSASRRRPTSTVASESLRSLETSTRR